MSDAISPVGGGGDSAPASAPVSSPAPTSAPASTGGGASGPAPAGDSFSPSGGDGPGAGSPGAGNVISGLQSGSGGPAGSQRTQDDLSAQAGSAVQQLAQSGQGGGQGGGQDNTKTVQIDPTGKGKNDNVWNALKNAGWSDKQISQNHLVDKVQQMNKLKDPSKVADGQSLKIPTNPGAGGGQAPQPGGARPQSPQQTQPVGPATPKTQTPTGQQPPAQQTPSPPSQAPGGVQSGLGTHTAKGTGYYPANNAMEGGYNDKKGHKLNTLQDYLAGKAPYVSVAMDQRMKYGTQLRIPEMEQKYGRPIDFRVVDTGGAFRNKGTSRIDIATANRQASMDPTINGPLTLQFQ